MNSFDILLIAPDQHFPSDGERDTIETPYGIVSARLHPLGSLRAAWVTPGASPFAALYAAKAAGASRVVELAPAAARNRLLESGDLLLPDDLIDRTRLARYTFFAGKGYGFLSQREPFCPALRGALLAAAAERVGNGAGLGARRVFARGVYLAAQEPERVEGESIWEADIVGGGVAPISFLARELELCYAPLCVVAALTPSSPPSALRLSPTAAREGGQRLRRSRKASRAGVE
jgi:5'-methylthioadenosine phosphorylase